ncbi:MAG: efflux transporter outer membrane subunit [Rhodanobacteraceae bacterium]
MIGRYTSLALIGLVLGACAMAPDKLPPPSLDRHAPLAGVPVDNAARWPAADWWKHYKDPQLDDLEARALREAPSLTSARSRFRVAVQRVKQARTEGGATLDANAQAQRQRLSENGFIPTQFLGFTWYNQGDLGLQFSYDFDFWGRRRAAIEAAISQARAAQAESNAAALLLTTAVADTYFAWQGDRTRLALARSAVEAQRRNRAIVAARTKQGIENPDDLSKADEALSQARELVLATKGSAQVRLVAVAALLGVAPADLPDLDTRPLPKIDSGLPADAGLDLVARRPDIAASRWRVEAAVQNVEQSRAAFFPDINLKAMAGFSSIDLGKLLAPGSRVLQFAPAMHLPLFDTGSLHARYGIDRARLDNAIADYNAAVVDAARDAATQSLKLTLAMQRADEQAMQVTATRQQRDFAAARVHVGVSDRRALIAADMQLLRQRDAAAVLAAQRAAADIALIKALGGGYRTSPSSKASATPARTGSQSP